MSGFSMTDTLSSLIEETTFMLQGYGVGNDLIATLTSDITDTDGGTFMVDSDQIVTRGIVEIDEELMWVQQSSGGQLVVPAWGRGWKGTSKATHAAGSPVYVSPTFPRSIVSREVNNTIRAVYPQVFGVGVYEFTIEPTLWQYELPAECEQVLDVEWRWDKVEGWHKLGGWEMTAKPSPTDFPSGPMLSINDPLMAGVSIVVRYAKRPMLLVEPTDPFAMTGLPPSCRDLVVLGASSRLLPWLDAGRLPVDSVQSDQQDQAKPVGNAVSVGRELRSLYAKRLAEERAVLLAKYPLRQHKVR